MKLTNRELIIKAKQLVYPKKLPDGYAGYVGCALISKKGNVYFGVSIDTCCSIGFCAEHSAIASMVTNREYIIKKIVSISRNGIISPCGRCRELMYQIHRKNLDAQIIIGTNKTISLRKLLPLPQK